MQLNPDNLLAGYRGELARLKAHAETVVGPDLAEVKKRVKEVEAEIERVTGLPRPAAAVKDIEAVADRDVAYLRGLEAELKRTPKEAWAAIEKEIAAVKAKIRSRGTSEATATPAAQTATTKIRRGKGKQKPPVEPPQEPSGDGGAPDPAAPSGDAPEASADGQSTSPDGTPPAGE